MSDPFAAGHRAAAAEQTKKDAAAAQAKIVERATAKGEASQKPKPVDKPYEPQRPPWAKTPD